MSKRNWSKKSYSVAFLVSATEYAIENNSQSKFKVLEQMGLEKNVFRKIVKYFPELSNEVQVIRNITTANRAKTRLINELRTIYNVEIVEVQTPQMEYA